MSTSGPITKFSANVLCACKHPAYLHSAGTCGGYAEIKEFTQQGSTSCSCMINQYQVIDDFLRDLNLLDTVQDALINQLDEEVQRMKEKK